MSCEFRPTDVMVTLLMLLLFGWLLVVPAASAQEAATAQESATAPEPIAGVAHGAESEDTPSVGVPADGGETTAAGPLANSSWHLVEFQSMSDEIGTVRPDVPKLYTMYLGGDGRVSMRLNCNRANGEWFAEPGVDGLRGRFWFGPLAATRAHCPPPSMDESIAAHSVYVRSYVFEDGKLYLSLMADGGIYVWQADAVVSPLLVACASQKDGGPRNWLVAGGPRKVNLLERPSPDAAVVGTYESGRVLDNLGCERIEGRLWCDVQELGGGPRGYVDAAFLEPAVSPDGSIRLGYDDSALRAGQGDFDATGTIQCAQGSGQPMGECGFGVARAGGGYATVIVTRPDGRTRAIFFTMGKPIGADTSQADGYPEFKASREGDTHIIDLGTERYRIPDAVVFGG